MLETFRHLAERSIEDSWIVDGLISPSGWTMLVGETGAGKSMLMIQLCDALQKGIPFLGLQTVQRDCIYFQADAGLIEWRSQVKQLAPESRVWTRHQLEVGCLDNELERKKLHEIVWGEYTPEVQGPSYIQLNKTLGGKYFDFIVFDCLTALTHEDLNSKSSLTKVLKYLDEIVVKRTIDKEGRQQTERVHYILVHHPNAQDKRSTISGAGNKGFSALCTTKLNLLSNNQASPPTGMLILAKSKLAGYREIALERLANGAWTLPYGNDRFNDFDEYSKPQNDEIPF